MRRAPLLLLSLSACLPTGPSTGEDDSEAPLYGGSDGVEDSDGLDGTADGTGGGGGTGTGGTDGSGATDDAGGTTTDGFPLGTWTTASARLESDPCDFDALLAPLGLTTALLVPEIFEVTDDPAGFAIRALDYGAATPVSCSLSGTSFACETQSVSPTFFELASIGWRYSVSYEGSLTDEGWLLGDATVSFPAADAETTTGLASLGFDLSECTQVVFLELAPSG